MLNLVFTVYIELHKIGRDVPSKITVNFFVGFNSND